MADDNNKLKAFIDKIARRFKKKEVFKHNIQSLNAVRRSLRGDPKDIINVLKDIPILSQSLIKKYLGAGVQKKAYLLDNGHVLVFAVKYTEGLHSGEMQEPLKALKSIQDRMFAGKGSKHDFMVYDFGRSTDPNIDFWWAELSQVIPLVLYISTFLPEIKHLEAWGYDFDSVARIFDDKLHKIMRRDQSKETSSWMPAKGKATRAQTLEAIRHPDIKKLLARLSDIGFPKSIVIGYAKAIGHIAETLGIAHVADYHSGNVGVNITNPNHVVFFDIT